MVPVSATCYQNLLSPFGVLPLHPRSYFIKPRYLPQFPCIWRWFTFTICPFNYTTTTSRDAICRSKLLFLIYLPSFKNRSHQHTSAWCVYADDILESTETSCSWGVLGGVWLSVRYSQLDVQQFSRSEHSKLKPLIAGSYICWLFNPNLKSEYSYFIFQGSCAPVLPLKCTMIGIFHTVLFLRLAWLFFVRRWYLSTVGFPACVSRLKLLCSALTTALEIARGNLFRAGRKEKESWSRKGSVRSGSHPLKHDSTSVFMPSQENLCWFISPWSRCLSNCIHHPINCSFLLIDWKRK